MENQEQAQTAGQDVTPTTSQQPELGVSDLQNIRVIIDTAVRRGAFGASEASAVGATFDRLNAFLNAVAPQPTTDTPADETPAA